MCRIHLQKDLTREEVKSSSKGMNLRLTTSQQIQSILMVKTMHRDKDTTLRLVNELIKLNGFNDLLSLIELTK